MVNFPYVSTMGVLLCGGPQGDVWIGNHQDSLGPGANVLERCSVRLGLTPKRTSFPLIVLVAFLLCCLRFLLQLHYRSVLALAVGDAQVRLR